MKKFTALKPWKRLGITRDQYRDSKPWRKSGISKARYEKMIMALPQEIINEARRHSEADMLMKEIFGEELVKDLD